MQVKEHSRKQVNRVSPEVYDEKVKKLRKESEKMIKGMFEFIDAQGGWLDFSYRFFKGEPIRTLRLVHGEITELPMGIVKHLNNCKKKIRKFGLQKGEGATQMNGELPEGRGLPSTYEVISRVRFTPMDVL